MGTDHEHRICTYSEAEAAIRRHDTVYVNDCFCRGPAKAGEANWDYCGHPVRTCMGFKVMEGMDYEYDTITRAQALEQMAAWKRQGNFFRFMMDEDWVCFCCKCGCGWFRDENGALGEDGCQRSGFIERTDSEACNLCGKCEDVCAYDARRIEDGQMLVDPEKCYGCGACEYACPEDAIAMAPR